AIEAGQWLHLEGDNGVGKTSLLRMACGLSSVAEGKITWQGQSIAQFPDAFRADLAYLGHQLALKEDLTPLEAGVGVAPTDEDVLIRACGFWTSPLWRSTQLPKMRSPR
ncbi:ATP-binding cassette domain-containing protein, partial [bacterium]|nr:ATP-binding cassette domain-containing protein [bacterium]